MSQRHPEAGSGTREVAVAGEAAHGFKSSRGLVELCRVSVRDRTGTHRDEDPYSTDPALTPAEIVGYSCGRWNIEECFALAKGDSGLDEYGVRSWRG